VSRLRGRIGCSSTDEASSMIPRRIMEPGVAEPPVVRGPERAPGWAPGRRGDDRHLLWFIPRPGVAGRMGLFGPAGAVRAEWTDEWHAADGMTPARSVRRRACWCCIALPRRGWAGMGLADRARPTSDAEQCTLRMYNSARRTNSSGGLASGYTADARIERAHLMPRASGPSRCGASAVSARRRRGSAGRS